MNESSFTAVKTLLTSISTSFVFSLFFFLILIMNDKSPRNSSKGLSAFSHGKTSFEKCRCETRHQVWIRFSDDKCPHTPLCVYGRAQQLLVSLKRVETKRDAGVSSSSHWDRGRTTRGTGHTLESPITRS